MSVSGTELSLTTQKEFHLRESSGSHGAENEDACLLGVVVRSRGNRTQFQRCSLLPSTEYNREPEQLLASQERLGSTEHTDGQMDINFALCNTCACLS
jgi:hypothetical protein